ncbi:MAG: methionine--tRNA ligase [Ruminococcus sp.]|nr:methionine--tRNA ligase [Ruminococcus sp.]
MNTENKKTFYITTPIYYPSGDPHIGHCYTTVACDTISRYKRMQGYDVMFLTGTDEHGQKIEQKAEAAGVTPKEFVDRIVATFKELWSYMNISYDRFIRTTDGYHVSAVQKIFKDLYDRGYIYKGKYSGKYCTPCESFWTESQLDENGCCPECHRPVKIAEEEAYFFKMSPFSDRLEKLLLETDYLNPRTRAVELVNNFIKPGLEDVCVSRTSFKWGIPVTFDEKHVVYVWIDALSNYITALGYDNDEYDDFAKYWPADVHMVAKDIMRFHALIWPAMLMALDIPLPKQLAVHGWITFQSKTGEAQKMSKSLGNVVDPLMLGKRYGVDSIRYHILREMALGADSAFSNEIMINRINSDLANGFGNLVSRTVAMADKYFGGTLPEEREAAEIDDSLIGELTALRDITDKCIDETRLKNALEAIFTAVDRANKYIDETEPWKLGKDESKRARLASVLYNLLESIRIISTLLAPFMPTMMPKVWEQIGAAESDASYDNAAGFGVLPANVTVHKGEILFPRIDLDKEIAELNAIIEKNMETAKAKLEAESADENTPENSDIPALLPEITIDDFAKLDIRAAKVLSVEKVKKSDKLLCFRLDDGMGGRQVVSGIAEYYTPEELTGKTVQIIANLKPIKLRGVESLGMICSADTADGVKVLFLDDSIPAGSKIR